MGQQKYAEAEPILGAAYAGLRQRVAQIPPQSKGRLTDVEGQLTELLEATRRKDETTLHANLTDAIHAAIRDVTLHAGKPVVIALSSKQFDTQLELQDAKGRTLAANDDIDYAGKNLNSRILFVPRADGVYRVVATSFRRQGRGAYDLVIRQYRTAQPKQRSRSAAKQESPAAPCGRGQG